MRQGAMLNAYPDSLGNDLSETVTLLSTPAWRDAFQSVYLLPTVFNSDLDGGFSIISYDLCESLARREDFDALRALGMDIACDMVLNHLSVLSPQFQDILHHGDGSVYRDFFIDWNRFWAGCGSMTDAGYILPDADKFAGLTLRKSGLPLLMARFPDSREVPYWNTFYQQVIYPEIDVFDLLELVHGQYRTAKRMAEVINAQLRAGVIPKQMDWRGFEAYQTATIDLMERRRRYLGQMDVNVQSPLVWAWYEKVMGQLAAYGVSTIRLDAYTRLHKAPGRANFMNEPETWQILERLRGMARKRGMEVLPEIHDSYASGAYRKLAALGCQVYDYFLPVLILDALDTADASWLSKWAREIIDDHLNVVNMLGCHDGIPIRDARGCVPDARIDALIDRLVARGGRLKMIHGATSEVYQMDISYFSALGGDEKKLLMARALQLFMPGKPQIWYMDVLAGENNLEAFERDPAADNRYINRRSYTLAEVEALSCKPVVAEQLRLLAMRNAHPAFSRDAAITVEQPEPHCIRLTWRSGEHWASLDADLRVMQYRIANSD